LFTVTVNQTWGTCVAVKGINIALSGRCKNLRSTFRNNNQTFNQQPL